MPGYRSVQFGVPTPPAGSAQVGQALAGGAGRAPGGMALPSLGLPSLMPGRAAAPGAHSGGSTDAALREAERRLAASPEREQHTPRSPVQRWQLATLGLPPLEVDLVTLASGQPFDDDDEEMV